jgi:hypothetical protein
VNVREAGVMHIAEETVPYTVFDPKKTTGKDIVDFWIKTMETTIEEGKKKGQS